MIRNLVKQSCAAPGTGTTITLGAVQPGFASFDSFGNATPCYVMLTDGAQSELQSSVVTVGSPSTLSRGNSLWNSAGTQPARLNFTGTCTVYNVTPAERAAYFDANNALNLAGRRLYGLPATPTTNDEPARLDAVAWRVLSAQVSAVAIGSFVFTLPAAFTRFRLEWQDTTPTASAQLYARMSFDGGSTYAAGASDYAWAGLSMGTASTASAGSGATTFAALSQPSANATLGTMEFSSGGAKLYTADAMMFAAGFAMQRFSAAGSCGVAGTATHILFGAVGTTLAGGRVRLLGGI